MPSWTRRLVAPAGIAALLLACPARARADVAPPAVVALTIDTSGSVGRAQLARARVLAEGLLKGLPAGSEIAVFTFDDASRLVVPRTSRPDEVRRRLATLAVSGRHTALFDALYDASRYLRDGPGLRKAVVLITDGRDEDSALNLDDGLRVACDARIPVHVVAVGHADVRVLRRIAKLTGGSYAPLGDVRTTALAALLRNAPATAPPPAQDAATPPGPATSRAPGPASASASPGAHAPEKAVAAEGGLRAKTWLLAPVVLAAMAAVVAFLVQRRRKGVADETSATETSAAETTATAASATVHDLSPTLLSRMNVTEEYLEKTMTLRPRPLLSVTRGADAGQVVELSDSVAISVGRAKANDLVLNDVSVSSQHCRIRPEDGRYVVHDLKSTNGTFVNERRVTSQPLAEGDVLKLGETHLQFHLDLRRS